MLKTLGQIDQELSNPLLQADSPTLSFILYPFAAFFHPKLIWVAYFTVYYISHFNKFATAVYIIGTGLCLLITFILKRVTRRPRPTLNDNLSKPHHFRKKQKNNSMPSGDAMQSALFVTYLYYLGVPLLPLILFQVGVCAGRVYYMCHWVMDTVVSTVLGVFLGWFMNQLRIQGELMGMDNTGAIASL